MKTSIKTLSLLIIILFSFSCKKETSHREIKIDAGNLTQHFDSKAGSNNILIFTEAELNAVSSDTTWCTAEIWTKNEQKQIVVLVKENRELNQRSAQISLTEKGKEKAVINIAQLGQGAGFLVKEESINLKDNLNFSLNIISNTPLAIQLPEWIENYSASGTEYKFTANQIPAEEDSRLGEIIIKDEAGGNPNQISIPVIQRQGLPTFAVISDVLTGRATSQEKLRKRLSTIINTGKSLDAIFIVGDLTDRGSASQYQELKQIVDSIIPAQIPVHYILGNSDHYHEKGEEVFLQELNQPIHNYMSIKGYPFVTIGMRGIYTDRFTQEDKDFLQKSLQDAQKNYPGKPIFYFSHIGSKETYYGTEKDKGDLGSEIMKPILMQFPQLIAFSGHANYTVADPRSIHQDVFTSVNIGSGIYSRIEYGYTEGMYPPNNENVYEALIVSVLENGDVAIERWDAARGEEILPEWLVQAPHDGTAFTYKNRNGGKAPEFAKNDKAVISHADDGAFTVTFPQATDDEAVHHYFIDVLDSDRIVFQNSRFSQFYLNSRMPAQFTVKLFGLPNDVSLKARITAVDSYGNVSKPLLSDSFVSSPFIPSEDATIPKADLFDIRFGENSTAKDISPNNIPVETGETLPETYYNETYQRYVAKFRNERTQFFKVDYKNSKRIKDAFFSGFALETAYMTNDLRNAAPLSGKEWEGVGIEQEEGGQIEFWAFVGDKFKKTKSSVFVTPGEYYHVIAMYDKNSAKMHLYVNGKKAGETDVPGDFFIPKREDCHWLAIGGDTHPSGRLTLPLNGDVVLARMYGRVLTDDEIYLLYNDFKAPLGLNR